MLERKKSAVSLFLVLYMCATIDSLAEDVQEEDARLGWARGWPW